jgi:hypothetical protein
MDGSISTRNVECGDFHVFVSQANNVVIVSFYEKEKKSLRHIFQFQYEIVPKII